MTAQRTTSRVPPTPPDGGRDALYVASLEKGLRVLRAFGAGDAWLGLREIAAQTGLHMSAVQRFAHTLHRLGYLIKDQRTRRYRLAPKVLDFAFFYLRALALPEIAMPQMIALGDECDETVNLSQLDGADTICIVRIPRRGVRMRAAVIGARRPAFCTSAGRAMLARLPEEDARRMVEAADRTALTPKTLVRTPAIMERLAHARDAGYSIVDEELLGGEISIAAPVLDASGRAIAAVNIPVPTTRWSVEAVRDRLAPPLLDTARAISRAMGSAAAFD